MLIRRLLSFSSGVADDENAQQMSPIPVELNRFKSAEFQRDFYCSRAG
jgi:hypothetical protein